MKFGEYLRAARLIKKLTLKEVAQEMGISVVYLSDIERGQRNPPKTEHIRKLASVIDGDDILGILLGYRDKDRGHAEIPLFHDKLMITYRDTIAIMLARKWLDLEDDTIEKIRMLLA